MKKNLITGLFLIYVFFGYSTIQAQKVVLSHKIFSAGYNKTGEIYNFFGEITNNSGKMVRGVMINVNYFDAAGKKLNGSNFLSTGQMEDYSDKLSPATDYLAAGASVPFKTIRFANKISGKVNKYEVVVTAMAIKAPTCAIIENVKSERIYDKTTELYYHLVSGNIKCTGGKCFSNKAIFVGYDKSGKLIQVKDRSIDGADELLNGNSKSFEYKLWEDDGEIAKVKIFPGYRGDWSED